MRPFGTLCSTYKKFLILMPLLLSCPAGCDRWIGAEKTVFLGCEPTQLVIAPGGQAVSRCEVRSVLGSRGDVRLQCSAPAGISCRFHPSQMTLFRDATATSQLNVGVDIHWSPGEVDLLAEAFIEDQRAAQQRLRLFVAETAFALTCEPTSFFIVRGYSEQANCYVLFFNNYKSQVNLSCEGLPPGVTCDVSPSIVVPSGFSSFGVTIAVNRLASPGNYTFQVTGRNGPIRQALDMQLKVGKGSFSLRCDPLSPAPDCWTTACQLTSDGYEGPVRLSWDNCPAICGRCSHAQCFVDPSSVVLAGDSSVPVAARICSVLCPFSLCARGGGITQCVYFSTTGIPYYFLPSLTE